VVQNLIDRMLVTGNEVGFCFLEVAQSNSPTVTLNGKTQKRCRNNITKPRAKASEIGNFLDEFFPILAIAPSY
jgi:hypothetical protein